MIQDKIVSRERAKEIITAWKAAGEKVVFTNGCFDLLHAGHVRYLEKAHSLGNRLIVAMNDDSSVRSLKGETRPIQPAADRATILAALESVDLVVAFSEQRVDNLLAEFQPDIFAKGGDYTLDTLHGPERDTVLSYGGEVIILPLDGPSTTEIIERIKQI